MRRFFSSLLFFSLLAFTGCKDPQAEYFKQIEANGFIPFKQPMSGVRSGSIMRGNPSALMPMAPATTCFPEQIDGKPTDLRWESDTDLAQTHFSAQLDFNAKINSIAAVGTPLINFKFGMKEIRKVDFEARGITVQMFDQFKLQDFFQKGMTDNCRTASYKNPFILNALFAKEMSFVFLNDFSGMIKIDMSKIEQIADIGLDVQWHIEDGYKLILSTPKYIGYHLVKMREQDNGMANLISHEVDYSKDSFTYVDYSNQ